MRREAAVIGGGPAGSSAALGLRRNGFEVTILEQRKCWNGRVCGAFLDPEAVFHLEELGVLDMTGNAGAVSVASATLTAPSGRLVQMDLRQGGRSGLALARKELEEGLLQAAERAGCHLELGTHVISVQPEGDAWIVTSRDTQAAHTSRRFPFVVLADGRFTLESSRTRKSRRGWFGWNAEFGGVLQTPGTLSLHFYPGGYVGILTFANGVSNVCGLTWHGVKQMKPWETVWQDALTHLPRLRGLMASAHRTSPWQGVGPLPFSSARRSTNGLILAGDAAAVGDPFMGEGIGRALGTGPLLAQSLVQAGNQHATAVAIGQAYDALWNARYTRRLRLGAWSRFLLRRSPFFSLALAILFRQPRLLQALTPIFHGTLDVKCDSAARNR